MCMPLVTALPRAYESEKGCMLDEEQTASLQELSGRCTYGYLQYCRLEAAACQLLEKSNLILV